MAFTVRAFLPRSRGCFHNLKNTPPPHFPARGRFYRAGRWALLLVVALSPIRAFADATAKHSPGRKLRRVVDRGRTRSDVAFRDPSRTPPIASGEVTGAYPSYRPNEATSFSTSRRREPPNAIIVSTVRPSRRATAGPCPSPLMTAVTVLLLLAARWLFAGFGEVKVEHLRLLAVLEVDKSLDAERHLDGRIHLPGQKRFVGC